MKKFLQLLSLVLIANFVHAQCSDLFFSEYVEGSSNNKAFEIYNPTAVPVNLTGYKIQLYTNGSTTPNSTFNLSGIINAGGVYVVANTSSNDSIKAYTDTLSSGVTNFNGNDALALLKGTDTLDVIGKIGDNPGNTAGWPVDTATTRDHTLIRKASVQGGTKNWTLGSTQWDVLQIDTIRLGAHAMNSCGAIVDTLVRFSTTSNAVNENAGVVAVGLQLNTVSGSSTFTVDAVLTGGTGTTADINNYTTQTITFSPGNASADLNITVTDDALTEGPETFIFTLRNASSPLQIGADSVFTLTINQSDALPQSVTIAQIRTNNANGQPDSLGKAVRVSGTVYGVNMRLDSLQFTIRDATSGVQVVSYNSSFGYTVNEGDSVALSGVVAFSNGMTQIEMDTVYKIGTGTLESPVLIQDLDETTESKLVRINNVSLVTPAQWGTGTSGYTCDITDGVGTWTLRIDAETNLFGTAAPTGNFDVIGIGGQFDNSSPYTSGYQLLPRYTQDIILINSIDDVDAGNVRIYPNPARNYTALKFLNTGTNLVTVYNTSGAVVFHSVTSDQNFVMHTESFTSGVYVVEVQNSGLISRSKLIIE